MRRKDLPSLCLLLISPAALTLGQKRSIVLTLGLQLFRSKPCELPMTSPKIFQLSRAMMPFLPLLFDLRPLGVSPGRQSCGSKDGHWFSGLLTMCSIDVDWLWLPVLEGTSRCERSAAFLFLAGNVLGGGDSRSLYLGREFDSL